LADTSPVVLFDFDGVFCDSTRECYTIALAARALIDETDSSRERVDELEGGDTLLGFFRSHRAYVRWPREYWLVLETFLAGGGAVTLTQRDFDVFEEACDPVALEFQQAFFDVRDNLRKNHYDAWIDLFDPYSSVVEGGRVVMEHLPFRILTGRDGSSVGAFLAKHGLEVPAEWIFDAKKFRNKVEGFEAIRAEMGRDRQYAFLDDNVTHLAALLPLGVHCYWATWGYSSQDHETTARELGPRIIRCDLDDWRDRLMGAMDLRREGISDETG
jgi:phosphoglycolate phosphatase-like HAD superfamily hydrolase